VVYPVWPGVAFLRMDIPLNSAKFPTEHEEDLEIRDKINSKPIQCGAAVSEGTIEDTIESGEINLAEQR